MRRQNVKLGFGGQFAPYHRKCMSLRGPKGRGNLPVRCFNIHGSTVDNPTLYREIATSGRCPSSQ